jgi:hypothetical protein
MPLPASGSPHSRAFLGKSVSPLRQFGVCDGAEETHRMLEFLTNRARLSREDYEMVRRDHTVLHARPDFARFLTSSKLTRDRGRDIVVIGVLTNP